VADHWRRHPRHVLTMAYSRGNAVQIDGLRELQKTLKTAPPGIKKLFNQEMKGVAAEITSAIKAQMPEDSGAAKRSVKPSYVGGWLAIRAGGSSAPYYPWLDFGGTLHAQGDRTNTQHRPFFKKGRWIYPTIERRRDAIHAKALDVVERWKRVNL